MGAESTRDRLRRLRRESGAGVEPQSGAGADSASGARVPVDSAVSAAGPTSPSPPEKIDGSQGRARSVPAWLKARLARSEERRVERELEGQPEGRSREAAPGGAAWPTTEGEPQGLVQHAGPAGPYWSRTELFAGAELHGNWQLDHVDGIDGRALSWLTGDEALKDLDPRRALYLDTETTGLSGGAGTWVYMVGLGSFLPSGEFELWQGFMRGPEEEPALLAEVARRVGAAGSLVSFFGKSFDRHRLQDKMRLCRVEPPFEGLPHLDLYHPLRRLFGDSFPDGRLATLEAELCGLERGVDLPGSQAPAAWFDFLAERPHRLEGVFHHNRLDVLSLVTLLAWLGRATGEVRPDGRPLEGPAPARRRGLISSCSRCGDWEQARAQVEAALLLEPEARDLGLARAELLRRLRQDAAAGEALEALASGPEDSFAAPVHLAWAKWLEHRAKDPARALAACERAGELMDLVPPGRGRAQLVRDWQSRLPRLQRRVGGV